MRPGGSEPLSRVQSTVSFWPSFQAVQGETARSQSRLSNFFFFFRLSTDTSRRKFWLVELQIPIWIHQRETKLAKHMACSCSGRHSKWWLNESFRNINTAIQFSFMLLLFLNHVSMIYKNNFCWCSVNWPLIELLESTNVTGHQLVLWGVQK